MKSPGFTLIELSIVLVIIGLIIGGILTGRDLINAATIRAQISQIEHYNTAVRTFQGKYGYLPGDIPTPYATQFGFKARGIYAGEGDGNGVIEGVDQNTAASNGGIFGETGEMALFWVDLGTAGLVDSTLSTATAASGFSNISGSALAKYMPGAKIGGGNYIYVWSGGADPLGMNYSAFNSTNYYGVSLVTNLDAGLGMIYSNVGLTVQQASGIDKKMDDGMPLTGSVSASYVNEGCIFVGALPTSTTSVPQAKTTCYDNGSTTTTNYQYSTGSTSQSGNNINCALSFRFQ